MALQCVRVDDTEDDGVDFPKFDSEEAKKKLDEYYKLDQILGEPYFYNEADRKTYRKVIKYFDASGFSDIILDTVGYLYENPCPLTIASNIYKTAFSSNGELKGMDSTLIKNEIQACSVRIETLKQEIKDWFIVLVKLLKKRKVHNPYGFVEPLKFDSLHLLNAFSIYSRPEDYPDANYSEEEPEPPKPEQTEDEAEEEGEDAKLRVKQPPDPKPFLVEPGETFLNKSVKLKWNPFETELDRRRESLKYEDIKDGIPPKLDIYFDWMVKPHAGLIPKGKAKPPASKKWTQTPPVPVNLQLAVQKQHNEEDDDDDEDADDDDDKPKGRTKNKGGKKHGYKASSKTHSAATSDSSKKNMEREHGRKKHGERKHHTSEISGERPKSKKRSNRKAEKLKRLEEKLKRKRENLLKEIKAHEERKRYNSEVSTPI